MPSAKALRHAARSPDPPPPATTGATVAKRHEVVGNVLLQSALSRRSRVCNTEATSIRINEVNKPRSVIRKAKESPPVTPTRFFLMQRDRRPCQC